MQIDIAVIGSNASQTQSWESKNDFLWVLSFRYKIKNLILNHRAELIFLRSSVNTRAKWMTREVLDLSEPKQREGPAERVR